MHVRMCHRVVRQYATRRLGAAGATGEEAWKEKESISTTGMVAVITSLALCDRVRRRSAKPSLKKARISWMVC
jgi:hypothetical protein